MDEDLSNFVLPRSSFKWEFHLLPDCPEARCPSMRLPGSARGQAERRRPSTTPYCRAPIPRPNQRGPLNEFRDCPQQLGDAPAVGAGAADDEVGTLPLSQSPAKEARSVQPSHPVKWFQDHLRCETCVARPACWPCSSGRGLPTACKQALLHGSETASMDQRNVSRGTIRPRSNWGGHRREMAKRS